MGLFKKVFRPVRKIAKKIIPKEVRPFLPYIATAFGPAAGGVAGMGFQEAAKKLALKGIIAGSTAAATDEDANILRTSLLAAAPAALEGGLGAISTKYGSSPLLKSGIPKSLQQLPGSGDPAQFFSETVLEQGLSPTSGSIGTSLANAAGKAGSFIGKQSNLKTIGAQTALDQSAKLAEINQDEIDKYNEELRKQGVLDKTKRRTSIYNIYLNAGYEPDYVNSMLDRYGYESGGRINFANGGGYRARAAEAMKGIMTMKDLLKDKPVAKPAPKIEADEDEEIEIDEDGKIKISRKDDLDTGLQAAADGVAKAFGRGFGEMEPVPMLRFAQGGEVEIEEETDDLGIMDLMRDQGIEYGEQVSNTQNDQILEMLFEKYLEMGLSPKDAAEAAQNEFDRMSRKSDQGIMQMASGYKDDIEEMYEQYVFEMEEQGLQPMSFSDFLRQARAGMADGGIMEKDMRGGGFIPEGTKERADDVPARLSKNEFVMTADAVRAAGGGSVNKGAKRMYDMMYNLEGKV